MLNIQSCPYCGGEVEVVRVKDKESFIEKKEKGLIKKEKVIEKQYRIECRQCRVLVAKGTKFPIETDEQGKKRIKEYEEYLENVFSRNIPKITQSFDAQRRDYEAKYSSSEGFIYKDESTEDEEYDDQYDEEDDEE